jgi:hypothetical protein
MSKIIFERESFRASFFTDDKNGMVIFYRRNSSKEFHRAIKVSKKELIELVEQIQEESK